MLRTASVHLAEDGVALAIEPCGESAQKPPVDQNGRGRGKFHTNPLTPPPSADRDFLLAQLSKNVENTCVKARRYHLEARRVFFLLRTQDYRHSGYEIKLSRPTNIPVEIISVVRDSFDRVYRQDVKYRLTGIVLSDLSREENAQLDLFGAALRAERMRHVYEAVDHLDAKFGKHTVFLGTSFQAIKGKQYIGERSNTPRRRQMLFNGEGERKRLGLPMLGEV